jgi:general secretion pathway protein F
MHYFSISYKYGKKKGSIVLEAANKIDAMEQFYEKNIGVLIKIRKVNKPVSVRFNEINEKMADPIKNKPVNMEKLIAILDQIAVMVDAGLPLNMVISEAVKTQDDKMIQAIFSNMLADIEGGKGFYESAVRYKVQLGNLTLSMIKLGEETGTLAESIAHLTLILQDILDNRKKFKKATRYPIVIMFAMGIAFTVVTIFVIPQFRAFFESSQMELPLPTQFLLWLEHALTAYGLYILAAATLIFMIMSYSYKKSEKVRLFLDKFILKIMIIGKATLYAMISRFIYVFRILVEAGIPMMDALSIASEIVDNSYIRSRIDVIPTAIEEGRSLYQGFEESGMFENMLVEMIKAGETGGGLDKMLGKVSKIYKDRFDYIVDNISTLIEPVLIAAIAGFVLTLALGIFLPMWNMVDLAG